jgi:hypothetical protein
MTRSLLGDRGQDEPWNAEPWTALYLLFKRDWRCRVWVAQGKHCYEIWSSRDLHML